MSDLTPLTRAQRDAYRRRVRDYEKLSRCPTSARVNLLMAAGLLNIEGFLDMGVFAGDELCVEAELAVDDFKCGFVTEMLQRCQVSATLWRAGK